MPGEPVKGLHHLGPSSPTLPDDAGGDGFAARVTLHSHCQCIQPVFRHARSLDPAHRAAIVGVLRGRADKLQSLFVRADHHRRGIGRRLVMHFEQACRQQGSSVIRLQATLYAVPFYRALGYKKSTGVRTGQIFDGTGFKYQPMKKVLRKDDSEQV